MYLCIQNIHCINKSSYILAILVAFEISCHSILQNYLSPGMYSAIYFLLGISIALFSLKTKLTTPIKEGYISRIWIFGLALLLGLIVQDVVKPLFEIWPLDYKSADMLPVIDIMVDRYCAGTPVYSIIPEIWDGMQPIYLPGLWLPYLLTSIMEIDMRWTGITFLLIATLSMLFPWQKNTWKANSLIVMMVILLALWMDWMYLDQIMIALTEEGVVIGYYALLCIALMSKRPLLIGITIGLCMMSRYMLAPWALMFVIAIWLLENKSQAYKIILSSGATIIIFMTFGQGWAALPVFLKVPDNYLSAVLADKAKYFSVIDSSLGMAKHWEFESLGGLHSLMKILSFLVPICCILIYKKWLQDIPFALFGLISLKLSLVFFFNFLVMPYSYLFYTSTIVSVSILSFVLTRK